MQDKLEKLRKEKEKKIQELKNEMKTIEDKRGKSSKHDSKPNEKVDQAQARAPVQAQPKQEAPHEA